MVAGHLRQIDNRRHPCSFYFKISSQKYMPKITDYHSYKIQFKGISNCNLLKMNQELASVLVPEKMSWATATQSISKCKIRIEKIGKSRVDTEPTAWGLDVQVWNLLWTGEEAMKKGIPILKMAGFESAEDLQRTAVRSILGSATTAQVVCNVEWSAKNPSACNQCAT